MLTIKVDDTGLAGLRNLRRAVVKATRKAMSTSARDMRSTASKRVRARKRLRVKLVNRALVTRRARVTTQGIQGEWGVDVRADPVRLSDYPHRQLKKGVSAAVNKGKRSRIQGAFVATMGTGHKGVFVRKGKSRLQIRELLASRPADALLHKGEAEAVQKRGRESFVRTFGRVLPLEIDKVSK